MHDKKTKGDIGLSYAIAIATDQGWSCCIPLSEHQTYDFIAEKDGICKRIQARYTTPKNNKMEVKLRSCWSDHNGTHVNMRKKGDYDSLAIYNPENKNVYFISDNEFDNKNAITIRLEPSKNGQKNGIRMAKDYIDLI